LKIDEKLALYEKVKDYLAYNESVQKLIDKYEMDSVEQEMKEQTIDNKISQTEKSIAIHTERVSNFQKSIIEMDSIEKSLIVYKYYLSAVHKNGIPAILIKEALPMIENKINDILKLITEFSIKFEMDETSIIANIYYDIDNYWPIELTSGFEKFIIAFAIRIALTQISNLSKSNFMIIDEGWGNFDADNLGNVGKIFEYLESNFKFILIVSHIDALKDAVNSMLEINVTDNGSYINNELE